MTNKIKNERNKSFLKQNISWKYMVAYLPIVLIFLSAKWLLDQYSISQILITGAIIISLLGLMWLLLIFPFYVIFFTLWVITIYHYGWLFGVGLGWLPSGIVAYLFSYIINAITIFIFFRETGSNQE